MLNKNTLYNVTFNLTSSSCNLVRYKTELKLDNGTIITSNEGFNSCGSELMITFNTSNYDYLYLYYYIDIGTGYYQLDPSIFNIANLYEGESSLSKAFKNLLNNRTDVKDRYGQLWWTLFLTFLILSSFTYFTGMELSNPGINLFLILFYVVFLSYAGLLTMDFGSGVDDWFNKYGLAILAFCMAGGFMLRRLD